MAAKPSYASPAHFRYHPKEVGELTPATTLADQSHLLLGERGERWVIRPGGAAEVASDFAPERLVDAVELGSGGWLFVGQAGGVYETRDPVGPFLRAGLPPEPLARVAVTSQALLGVTYQGSVLRSLDFGQRWELAPTEGRAVDLELLADGQGLLLTIPEQLYRTEDHGLTFEKLPVTPSGVTALYSRGDSIAVQSVLGTRSYTPSKDSPWGDASSRASAPVPKARLPEGPSVAALQAGLAAASDGAYFELRPGPRGLALRRGEFGAALSAGSPLATLDCDAARIAARGARLLVVCADGEEDEVELSFHYSMDAGKTFRRLSQRSRGSLENARFALLPGGRFVISGICPADSVGPGCNEEGIHYAVPAQQSPKQRGMQLRAASVPSLFGLPLAIVAAPGGERVYAFGRRTKGDALGVFVSNDGGETFSAHEVAELNLETAQAFAGLRVLSAQVGTDGYVSLVVFEPSARQQVLLVLDEEGRFISLSQAPKADATIGASGLKAVSVTYPAGEVFESLDGGAAWHLVGRVPTKECDTRACAVSCVSQGCVIGEALTRVGWEGQQESLLASPTSSDPGRTQVREVQSTATCRLDDATGWTPFLSEVPPEATSAALGQSAWFGFDVDFTKSSIDFHEMPLKGPSLQTQPLIPASKDPATTALFITHQIEGAAALRQTDGRGIELAWVNLFESTKARRFRMPPSVSVPSKATRFQTRLAVPVALTVGRGGLFFVPDEKGAVFFDGTSTKSIAYARWPDDIDAGRDELLRVSGHEYAVRFFGTDASLAWHSVEGPDAARAMTVGYPQPTDFGVRQEMTIAYVHDSPGLHVVRHGDGAPIGQVFPFEQGTGILGAPVSVPSQVHLPSEPRACSEQVRRTTPRVVSPFAGGTRHAVVVTDPSEPMPLLVTKNAVLHGSPDDPCAMVFDAELVTKGPFMAALVFTDPTLRSWAFRQVPEATSTDELEFRPMTCTFEASAEVPEEVFAAPGTTR